MIRPTCARVSLSAIRHNVRSVLDLIGPQTELTVMVKADAYGHGAVPVAKAALSEGASHLGVALVEEALVLRRAGVSAPILVFTAIMPQDAPVVVEHDLTPVLSSLTFAEALDRAARAAGKAQPVHVNVDTGMGRYGFQVRDTDTLAAIRSIASLKGLSLQGIMTHFASSDDAGANDFTRGQLARFRELLDALAAVGVKPPIHHAANSAGILVHPDSRPNMVRLGLGLYGYYPSPNVSRTVELQPSLELVSRIVHLKTCPPGTTIGYGSTFTATRPSLIGVVPIGYADGYPRELSNRGKVIVLSGPDRTRTVCPLAGRVCMDDIMVDVTDAPGVAVADEVILYSNRREDPNSVESTATLLGTIPYTLTTRLSARVPRIHLDT
jgi:alanine racemase